MALSKLRCARTSLRWDPQRSGRTSDTLRDLRYVSGIFWLSQLTCIKLATNSVPVKNGPANTSRTMIFTVNALSLVGVPARPYPRVLSRPVQSTRIWESRITPLNRAAHRRSPPTPIRPRSVLDRSPAARRRRMRRPEHRRMR